MSHSFEVDVRDLLARRIDGAPPAHGWSEIERRASGADRPAAAPGGRPSPLVVVLAIAAAAVLIVAGAVILFGDDPGTVVIDEGPTPTELDRPEPTVNEDSGNEGAIAVDDSIADDAATSDDLAGTAAAGFAPIEPGTWHLAAAFSDSSIPRGEVGQAAVQVRGWPGVLAVEIAETGADWERLTGLRGALCDGDRSGPPCTSGIVLLALDGQHQAIGRRLESELAMVTLRADAAHVEFVQAYFAAAVDRASPAPLRFDPTPLGREVPLAGPFTDNASGSCERQACDVVDEFAVEVQIDGEAVRFSVSVAEFESGVRLLLDGDAGAGVREISGLLPGSGGSAGVLAETWQLGRTLGMVYVVGLPLGVAVVTVELADGSVVWQRPLAGMAVLPDTAAPDDDFVPSATTVTALDGDGNEVLLIDTQEIPEPVVTDLRVDLDLVTDAAQDVADLSRTVEAGDLTVAWSEITWTPDEGPTEAFLRHAVATSSGVLGIGGRADETGIVWRWNEGLRWEPVPELADYDVGWLVEGGGRVIASGLRRADGRSAIVQSFDGRIWTEIDATALGDDPAPVGSTSASGLSIVGISGDAPGVPIVIEGDRVAEVYDPPWPTPTPDGGPVDTVTHFFEVLDDEDGPVVVRNFWADDENGSAVEASEAWRYLGGGQFVPPVPIPMIQAGGHTAEVGDMMLRVDRTGYKPDNGVIVGEISEAPLLTSTNGTEWTMHSTLTSETNQGLIMDAGDFFWAYGLAAGSQSLRRGGSFATIWLSTDAMNWSPLDVSFPASSESFINVVGEWIFVFEWQRDDYWVGRVERS